MEGARSQKRNMTSFPTQGKTFEKLEQDETVLRKGERSSTLPAGSSRRGDVNIQEEDLKKLQEQQTALKGRVRRGSLIFTRAQDNDLEAFWDQTPDLDLHVHGKLSPNQVDNVPGAEREAILYGLSNPADLKGKYRFVYSCVKGAKGYNDTTPNQDNFSYTVYKGWHIMIVMDGHGPCGHRVSTRCVQTIPYYLARSSYFPHNLPQALDESFKASNKDLLGYAIEHDIDVQASGSTCSLFMVNGDTYYTANVGDSRVVIGYEDGKDVIFETLDHKPGVEAEKERIEANGGEIRTLRYDDFTVDRIFVAGCDYPGLCMSRSFGDECVKSCGVSCEPEVCGPMKLDMKREPFMVIASDGVWEFIDSAWCVKAMVKKLSTESPEKIVHKLSKEARRRWKQEEGEYCDDITVCFQQLKNIGSHTG